MSTRSSSSSRHSSPLSQRSNSRFTSERKHAASNHPSRSNSRQSKSPSRNHPASAQMTPRSPAAQLFTDPVPTTPGNRPASLLDFALPGSWSADDYEMLRSPDAWLTDREREELDHIADVIALLKSRQEKILNRKRPSLPRKEESPAPKTKRRAPENPELVAATAMLADLRTQEQDLQPPARQRKLDNLRSESLRKKKKKLTNH